MRRPARVRSPLPGSRSRGGPADAGHALALALRAAYLAFHRRSNAAFAPFQLTADQFVLLTALAECDGGTQKELARRTTSDPNTISEMLRRLERRGLVARASHAEDGRALRVSLTAAGREAQRLALEGGAALRQELVHLIPARERAKFIGHLHRVAEEMRATVFAPTPRSASHF